MDTCKDVYVNMRGYIRICIYVYVCIYVYMNICIYEYTYIRIHVYAHTFKGVDVFVHALYLYMYAHTDLLYDFLCYVLCILYVYTCMYLDACINAFSISLSL